MSTDAMYLACNDVTVQAYAATGAQVYMYTFEYRGENSMIELKHGTPIAYFDPGKYLQNIPTIQFTTKENYICTSRIKFHRIVCKSQVIRAGTFSSVLLS